MCVEHNAGNISATFFNVVTFCIFDQIYAKQNEICIYSSKYFCERQKLRHSGHTATSTELPVLQFPVQLSYFTTLSA